MKTVLITGASSGIGKEAAKLFVTQGFRVIAAARSLPKMQDLAALGCMVVPMDITSETNIQAAFEQIYQQTDHVDILINNAGYAQNGFLEELSIQQLRHQFEVNVFGLVRVTQMVLPKMRARKEGLIINVGSMGGDFTSAGAGAYHASKYALESITDGMRQELSAFGIKVVLVKPGGVETDFIQHANLFYPEPIEGNPYGRMRENFHRMLAAVLDPQKSSFEILKPATVAQAIYDSTLKPRPDTRVRVGRSARMIPVVKWVLGDRRFDRMILQQLGLQK